MQDALALRHSVVKTIREILDERDFLEIETPFLTRSTPEGARDFLVPARIAVGSFYALPQSPQLFKQLLMIGGFERYYQIVRCFRDEDARADRLPEFTQLDIEMAFVEEEDVLETSEAAIGAVFDRAGFDVPAPPWPRMTHAEAVGRFGSDRPDTRFGLELKSTSATRSQAASSRSSPARFSREGVVRGINAGARELTRSDLDTLTELARQHGAKGLVWAFVQDQSHPPAEGSGALLSPSSSPPRRSPPSPRRSTASPATSCSSSPTRPPPRARCWGRCAWSWRAALTSCRRAPTTSAGWSSSRCSPSSPTSSAGMPSITPSPLPRPRAAAGHGRRHGRPRRAPVTLL